MHVGSCQPSRTNQVCPARHSHLCRLRQILSIDLNDLSRAEVYCRLLMARPCDVVEPLFIQLKLS